MPAKYKKNEVASRIHLKIGNDLILYTIESIQLSNFNDSKKIKANQANPSTLVYQIEVQDQINGWQTSRGHKRQIFVNKMRKILVDILSTTSTVFG